MRRRCSTEHETERDNGMFTFLQQFRMKFLQKRDQQMTETKQQQTKALVLGGGGIAGISWETGILVGLAHAGIDVRNADLFIGTSDGDDGP